MFSPFWRFKRRQFSRGIIVAAEKTMNGNADLLTGMSDEELEALADSMLSPSAQTRLDCLLELNSEGRLPASDEQELDRLLARVDQLSILKTRARYTLGHKAGASGS
jgi:hypothetical protein